MPASLPVVNAPSRPLTADAVEVVGQVIGVTGTAAHDHQHDDHSDDRSPPHPGTPAAAWLGVASFRRRALLVRAFERSRRLQTGAVCHPARRDLPRAPGEGGPERPRATAGSRAGAPIEAVA